MQHTRICICAQKSEESSNQVFFKNSERFSDQRDVVLRVTSKSSLNQRSPRCPRTNPVSFLIANLEKPGLLWPRFEVTDRSIPWKTQRLRAFGEIQSFGFYPRSSQLSNSHDQEGSTNDLNNYKEYP